MKPHIKPKDGRYWVFSSKQASVDCLPSFKTITLSLALIRAREMREKYNAL